MVPPRPTPTSIQLGVSNSKMLRRGLLQRCPVCGSGGTHRHWFRLAERCATCDLRFERIEGHSIGYIGLNVSVTFTATFVVLLGMTIASHPHVEVLPLAIGCLTTALLLPVIFQPSSHTLWTAIDLILRPLEPGEIDPRYVTIDPPRDADD